MADRLDREKPGAPADGQAVRQADGRLRKGEQRRRRLLDATLRVIGDGGVRAVTQRAVAQEANLPPSAVMYYFPTVPELLAAALIDCNDGWIARLEELRTHPRERALWLFARDIAQEGVEDRSRLVAECELWLLPARRPELLPELERWNAAVYELVARFVSDPDVRHAAVATVNGLFLQALAPSPRNSADEVHRILRATLR